MLDSLIQKNKFLVKDSWKQDFFLLFAAIFVFFCIGLGARPYITPSEARYIEIPRQIITTGDWLTPHINGVQYFEKPPLFYWIQAVFLSIGNIFSGGEFWGRIATSLVVALTCLVAYATGRVIYSRRAGLLAALTLATSVLGYGLSRVAMLDAPVTLFLTCSIASFIFAQKTGEKKYYYFMYAAVALAMLTKGLIGIVIPALVIGTWIALSNNWKILKEARLFTGLLLFLAIAAPWHIVMAIKHPEFLNFYFIHEHFTRYLTNEHKRTAPWWFFIAVTLAGALPWIGALGKFSNSCHTAEGRYLCHNNSVKEKLLAWMPLCSGMTGLLLLWILIPLLFFSTSHSKLVPYIFPIFPPLFVLIGKVLAEWWEMPVAPKLLRANALFVSVAAIIGLAILHIKFAIGILCLLPLALVIFALLAAAIIKKTPAKTLIAWLMVFGAALGITANYTASQLDKRTVKPLAEQLKSVLKADDMVVAYSSYWQDLPVYLNRNITVVDWQGELGFGVEHTPNAKEWMISSEEFWKKCENAKTNIYVFMPDEDFVNLKKHSGCELKEINSYGKTVLLQKENKQ